MGFNLGFKGLKMWIIISGFCCCYGMAIPWYAVVLSQLAVVSFTYLWL